MSSAYAPGLLPQPGTCRPLASPALPRLCTSRAMHSLVESLGANVAVRGGQSALKGAQSATPRRATHTRTTSFRQMGINPPSSRERCNGARVLLFRRAFWARRHRTGETV